jgi:hypothetical protein
MYISTDFIMGVNVGFEYIEAGDGHFFVIDLFIVRILLEFPKETL